MQRADRIADPHRGAEGILLQLRSRIRAVGNRVQTHRLDEAEHVRWGGHAHFVSSAQQLQTYRGAGLHIAAGPMNRYNEFHVSFSHSSPAKP